MFPEGNYGGNGVFCLAKGGMGLETGAAACFFSGEKTKMCYSTRSYIGKSLFLQTD